MRIDGPHHRVVTQAKAGPVSYRAVSLEDCKAWARGFTKPGPYGALFDVFRVNPGGTETHVARFRAGTCKPEPRKPVARIVKENLTSVKKNLLDNPWF